MYKFSVSGLRGKAFLEVFPFDFFSFSYLFSKKQKEEKILVGYDTRPSSEVFYFSALAGIFQSGKDVIDCGIIPTPTLVFASKEFKLPGIVITASHNPVDENGLKLVKAGRFLFEKEIRLLKLEKIKKELKRKPKIEVLNKEEIFFKHAQKMKENIGAQFENFSDFKVGIDGVNGSISSEIHYFCNFFSLNFSPLFLKEKIEKDFPRAPEPSSEALKMLSNLVKEKGLHLGIGFDPDGDRAAFVCENGEILSEEYTLPLSLLYYLQYKKSPVVCNFSTSLLVNDVCERFGVPLYRTKVGESNVVYQMIKRKSFIGGEGNGGVIVKDVNLTRDGLVAFYLILSLIKEKEKPLSILKKSFNDYIIIKRKLAAKKALFLKMKAKIKKEVKRLFKKDLIINEEDGLFLYQRNFLFHLRPANTEKVLRLIINADDEKIVEKLYEILCVE
jgi:phosphomannomutase